MITCIVLLQLLSTLLVIFFMQALRILEPLLGPRSSTPSATLVCRYVSLSYHMRLMTNLAIRTAQMLQSITIADVTTLRYRAFWSGIFSMPYIINTFISAEVYNGVMSGGGWRWGYGMFAILVPTCLVPVVGSLLWGQWKAKKEGKLMLVPVPEKNFLKRPISASYLASKEMDVSKG